MNAAIDELQQRIHLVFEGTREQLAAIEREIDAASRRLCVARDCLREHLQVLAEADNPHRQKHIEGAIVALQSEDIAGQMLDHARYRVNVLLALAHALEPSNLPPGRLAQELDAASHALAALQRHRRPVALAPVTVGELEFF